MIQMISEDGRLKPKIYEFVVDDADELEGLPTNVGVGSTAKCIENSKIYMLNGSGEWTEVNFKQGSGGGGGGNFVVTFSTEDYQTFTSDKTFAQIESAIASGQNVVASAMGYVLVPVQYVEGEVIIFSAVVPTSETSISAITMTMEYTDSITPMETSISQG